MAFSICYWANYTEDDRVLKFLYDADYTSCWILIAMSPEIQEWWHKSRFRINNFYLFTHPIALSTAFEIVPNVQQFLNVVNSWLLYALLDKVVN